MIDMKRQLSAIASAKSARFLKKFRNEEDGVMVVFSMFLLVLMLIVSGMAVDFMRLESRRAMLQGTVDRAVLAAADLDQELSPHDVVADYFAKSGMGSVVWDADIREDTNYRSVSATATLNLNTFFLRLIDMDTLNAVAQSTAVEGVGNIEVSLVVDISGSMDDPTLDAAGNETSTSKIDKLKTAANTFVDTLITEDTTDRVSLSFVPYSAHVNAGPEIYSQFNTTDLHSYSYCLDFDESSFMTTAVDPTANHEQVPHYQWNPAYDDRGDLIPLVAEPICPMYSFEQIIPFSQNTSALKGAIAQLEPRGGTAIFLGLKWGVALLDPTIRNVIGGLSTPIDAAFQGRPVDYADQNDPSGTVKYVVLMTDGENSSHRRLRDFAYDTPSKIAHWANMSYLYFYYRDSGYLDPDVYVEYKWDEDDADGYMQDVCTAAKNNGIIIYGIAMEAGDHGEDEMETCASSPSHYYQTSGDELEDIFLAIAEQITDLRLTQ